MLGESDPACYLTQKWGRNSPRSVKRSLSQKNPQTQTMDKPTGLTSSIAGNRNEMPEELPKPLPNSSHVHRLAALVTEKADLLKELAMLRKSYQDEVKKGSKGKAAASAAAPEKQILLRPLLMAVRPSHFIPMKNRQRSPCKHLKVSCINAQEQPLGV